MDFVATFEGDIPGASAPECGNYADQNLPEARAVAADMALVLQGWAEDALAY